MSFVGVGKVGIVRDAITPDVPGRLFVHGELWRAASAVPLATGMRARITAVHGLELVVNPEES